MCRKLLGCFVYLSGTSMAFLVMTPQCHAAHSPAMEFLSVFSRAMTRSNSLMKPTARPRKPFTVFARTPCRGDSATKNKMNPKVDGFLKKAKKWREEFEKLRKVCLDCGLTEELKW